MSDNCPVTHYICGKPCGMLQNAYKNTNLLANKCMFAQKKSLYQPTFSFTSSILVIVLFIILNSKRPMVTTSLSFGKLWYS